MKPHTTYHIQHTTKRGLPRRNAPREREAGSLRHGVSYVRGQSLFEVVFAVGVMAIILVGVVALATRSVRNSSLSGENAVATKYAQEAVEWLRSQRDANWTNLSSHIGTTCLTSNPLTSWGGAVPCPITGDTSFQRRAILTLVNSTTIDAAVEVSWTDSSGTHTVRSVTRFTNWNK